MSKNMRGKRPRRDLGRRERHLTVYGHAPQTLDTASRDLRPPALLTLQPGTVVWAHIPFQDDPGTTKARPAVVLTARPDEVDLVPLTSSRRRLHFGAVELQDWAQAGLTRPCGLARRIVTVDRRTDVLNVIGALSDTDREHLDQIASAVAS